MALSRRPQSRVVGQRLNLDEPLRREPRLDHRAASSHLPSAHRESFDGDEKALRFQIFEHALARLESVQPLICAGVLVHLRVLVHDFDLRQIVAQAGLEVVGIVRRRDLHRARAEFRIGKLVGDDRNLAIHQRQQTFLPCRWRVALVLGIHRNGGIAQHRLRTRRGNGDELPS